MRNQYITLGCWEFGFGFDVGGGIVERPWLDLLRMEISSSRSLLAFLFLYFGRFLWILLWLFSVMPYILSL